MRRPRRPTAAELALWQRAMGETAPLDEPAGRPGAPEPQPPPAAPRERLVPRATPRRPSAALDPSRPVDLDRRTWLRLKRGQVDVEQTLDLHGRTQDAAHAALDRFLGATHAAGCRCVLVVTGKGGEGGGVLRQMVPRWLNEGVNRERIVAFSPAQPRHGGTGALYVLLRRRRTTR